MNRYKAYENPEFMRSREARTLRILSEYLEPEKRFKDYNIDHTIVFFGSARTHPESGNSFSSHYYAAAEETAYQVSLLTREIEEETGEGVYICSGGGPGIMEAANRGAARADDRSIGLNIEIPFEQGSNQYITPELNFQFHYFFTRKLWFLYQAKAIIVFPGGFGTMDELFETLTLVQTRKLEKLNIPILLYDREFWDDLINFQKFAEYGLISPEDLELFHFFSKPSEAVDYLKPRLINIIHNINELIEKKFPI